MSVRARSSAFVAVALVAGCLGWVAMAPPVGADDAYATVVKADSPVGYWRMDDASDSVGTNGGTVSGAVTQGVAGAIAGSTTMHFAGTSRMALPKVSQLQPASAVSVESWARTTYTQYNTQAFGVGNIIRDRAFGYELQVGAGTGAQALPTAYAYGNGSDASLSHNVSINDGQWHHLVFTADISHSYLYVDGVQVATGTGIGSGVHYDGGGGIAIGQDGDNPASYFVGDIDEVALYDHALTLAQVQSHYAAAGGYVTPPATLMGSTVMAGSSEDPVETAHGNFHDSIEDLATPAGVYGMDFTRYYNSLDSTVGTLGRGWRTTDSTSLSVAGSGEVDVTLDDGRLVSYVPDSAGGYVQPLEFAGTLTATGGGAYQIAFAGGEVWQFDSSGRLSSLSDGGGQTVTIGRDGSGRLSTLTSSTGATLTLGYTSGLLTSVTSSDGRTAGYGYTSGSLTTATDPAGKTTAIGVTGSGVVNQITDPTGVVVVANTYDSDGRVATQTTPDGTSTFVYDPPTHTTTVTTSPGGEVMTYLHDEKGRLLKITDPYNNPTGNRAYNAGGFLTSTTDRTGVTAGATFDNHGNQLTSVDPASGPTTYTYDSANRIATVNDLEHGTTTYGYDGAELIPSTITDAQGHVTAQDVVGEQVRSITDPDGVTTNFTYDAANRVLTSSDAASHTTTYTYDGAGHRLSAQIPSGGTTLWTYDGNGRVLTETAPDLGVTHYAYTARDV